MTKSEQQRRDRLFKKEQTQGPMTTKEDLTFMSLKKEKTEKAGLKRDSNKKMATNFPDVTKDTNQ